MNFIIIPAIPFLLAIMLLVEPSRQKLSRRLQALLISLTMGGLFVYLLQAIPLLPHDGGLTQVIPWLDMLGISFNLYLDGLSLFFALIITGVGALIFWYSGDYFDERIEAGRFNSNLLVFCGAMLGVVLAGNLLTMFIMWELTSITSFLLIGFKGKKDASARSGALQALMITGAGGLALLGGLLLLGYASGAGFSLELSTILETSLAEHAWYPVILLLILGGAFTKSAQMPFHFWLPGAMAAPTPASAFLHSATMVKAGIYLLARLSPVLGDSPLWTAALVGFGLMTMLLGAIFAIRQRDLKGLLAYSTVSQLGALVALLGLPHGAGYKAALIGILAHACYKAALFLIVGAIDHAAGTRLIDRLGGLWRKDRALGVVTFVSALSLAGVPFFFGFLAKEAMLEAVSEWAAWGVAIVAISAVFNVIAALIITYNIFIRPAKHEVHWHPLPRTILIAPAVLAVGSLSLGVLAESTLTPLLEAVTGKHISIHLFEGITPLFLISLAALSAGVVGFILREKVSIPTLRLPSAATFYQAAMASLDWLGDRALKVQNGWLRYYLITVLGVVALILGLRVLPDTAQSNHLFGQELTLTLTTVLDITLLILAIGAALFSVFVRNHLLAALSLGVMGYAVGAIFLLEPAPDVALVQFLIETLATVMIIIILSRTSTQKRQQVMQRLWHTHTGIGPLRDAIIAITVGAAVTVFALIAVANRPTRDTIAEWHIAHTEETGVHDIVGAIVTDFRGMDTLVEITVFGVAALGLSALLTLNRNKVASPKTQPVETLLARMRTPFTRTVASAVLPVSFLVAISHILFGGEAPGDGFTGGVVAGLGIALYYVVMGYDDVRQQLPWLKSLRFLNMGWVLALGNAFIPMLFGKPFLYLAHIDFSFAGVHLGTALIYELAIALTVFGGVGAILEAIAYPQDIRDTAAEPVTLAQSNGHHQAPKPNTLRQPEHIVET
ncbi:MAG: DUF4040 domain-containing protein [Chloroflexi bacterium]|nr:MAG: DUF4040 domain-containing protein [Chloroflexota bacterium]